MISGRASIENKTKDLLFNLYTHAAATMERLFLKQLE
jgi:hypothetical protein